MISFAPLFTSYIEQMNMTSVAVINPKECTDFQWLVGQSVTINDDIYLVENVHTESHKSSYPQGEHIGLMVSGYKHKIAPGNKVRIVHDIPEINIAAGSAGTITAYLPDQRKFAIFFGPDQWVSFNETEPEFLKRCETFTQDKRLCPDCGVELFIIMSHPLAWKCQKCSQQYAIMDGQFKIFPERGKLEDWPEMQKYMDDQMRIMLTEAAEDK